MANLLHLELLTKQELEVFAEYKICAILEFIRELHTTEFVRHSVIYVPTCKQSLDSDIIHLAAKIRTLPPSIGSS